MRCWKLKFPYFYRNSLFISVFQGSLSMSAWILVLSGSYSCMMSSWKGSIVFESTVHTIISLKKENSCTDQSKIPALGKFQVHCGARHGKRHVFDMWQFWIVKRIRNYTPSKICAFQYIRWQKFLLCLNEVNYFHYSKCSTVP